MPHSFQKFWFTAGLNAEMEWWKCLVRSKVVHVMVSRKQDKKGGDRNHYNAVTLQMHEALGATLALNHNSWSRCLSDNTRFKVLG